MALIAYVYCGYPAAVWLVSKLKPDYPGMQTHNVEPTVSLVIAAFNEERAIRQKLKNSLALDYPKGKLDIIVVSDGSTDETATVVRGYIDQTVQLVELSQNLGKASAQNEGVKQATGDILLFTDANVALKRHAVHELVKHFEDDGVGCVIGKVTYVNEGETGVSEGEGLYWRYELFLRRMESKVGNLLAGSGPIMGFSRALFEPLDPAVSEDFFLPMKAAIKGYRTVFEPDAVSSERLFQVNPRDMFKTKARTITLDTRSISLCRAILNPFQYPLYAWGLISHKLLRWLVPYLLIALFVLNLLLLDQPFYRLSLALQVAAYTAAGLGYLWQRAGRKPPRILGIPFSFCLLNLAALVGVARFVMGKTSGRWEPVREPVQ